MTLHGWRPWLSGLISRPMWGVTLQVLVAVMAGGAAATGSLLPIMLVAGVILAPLLLLNPKFTTWVLLVGALVAYGVLSLWNDGLTAKLAWSLSGLSFALLAVIGLRRLFSIAREPSAGAHVQMALLFMGYAVLASMMQGAPFTETITAFKRYFQGFGLMAVLAWAPFALRDMQRLGRFVIFLALLQLPFALFERVKLVPIRESLQALYPGMVPIDVVAGTFGASMTGGGGSAEMATYLLFVLVGLINRARLKVVTWRSLAVLVPLVALPLGMGETKVVVIFLPLLLLTLFRQTFWKRPAVGVAILVAGAIATAATGLAYLSLSGRDINGEVMDTVAYNFGSKGHGNNYLNRTTSLIFWQQQQSLGNPVSPIFGNGMGSSHDATGGHIAAAHLGYGVGLTAAATLLWDLGIVGMALYFAVFVAAWRTASEVSLSALPAWMRSDAQALQAMLPVLAIYTFYRLTPLEQLPFELLVAGILGYLAWLRRQVPCKPSLGGGVGA